jgi:putative ABC transport system permease protein
MDWLRYDLRAALRLFTRRPGYSLLAVLTLAIGLGMNTVAFSAVNALLFRSKRIAHGQELGWLSVGTRTQPLTDGSLPMFERVRRESTTLQSVVAEGRMALAYETGGQTDQIWALFVSPDYFSTVPVPLAFGRTWRPDETAPDTLVVLVSERFWQSRLGASRDLSTLTLRVNRQPARVAGVVRDDFEDPGGVYQPDVFVSLSARGLLGVPKAFGESSTRWLTLIAKPQPGATPDAIRSDVLAIGRDQAANERASADDVRVSYARFADGNPALLGFGRIATIGLTAVGAVLLIACFNVAGLLLARSVERQRELGIRSALGASRARLVSQLLAENAVLSAVAGIVAILFAHWSAILLSAFSLPAPIPERLQFPTDWRLFGYTAALCALAAVIPALAPAWHVLRSDLTSWLKAGGGAVGGRRQTQVRRAFVIVQTAGSTLFLTASLLFAQSFINALTHEPGFETDHTVVLEIDPAHYGYSPERARLLLAQLRERVQGLPGVQDVGVADRLPFFVGIGRNRVVSLDGRDCRVSRCPEAGTYAVDDGFFRAMRIPIRAGRAFAREDGPDAVVVSETAASQFWPGQNPVGQSFRDGPDARMRQVVGVVPDVTQRSFNEVARPHFYQTIRNASVDGMLAVVVRTGADPRDLIMPIRDAVHGLDPALPVQSVQTMRERMALPLWLPRTMAGFFGICGVVAVLLATVGLFGVTYFVVMQRTREFGVRLALGATGAGLRRLVVGEALGLVTPGILIGVLAAVAAGLAARSLLFGVSAASPVTYIIAAGAQSLVAVAASWIPAIRAAGVDPLTALRSE